MSGILDDKTYVILLGECEAGLDVVDACDIDGIASQIAQLARA